MTGALLGWVGAVGTPGYSFAADANTGMWSPAADTIAWSRGGSEAMRLDANGLGLNIQPSTRLTFGETVAAPYALAYWDANNTDAGAVDRGGFLVQTRNFSGSPFPIGMIAYTSALDSTYSGGLRFTTVSSGTTLTALKLWEDGRISGAALHNNAGSMTGPTNQYIGSGTYSPVLTNVANIPGASLAGACKWTRLGNIVTVSGVIQTGVLTAGASTITQLRIALPIASNIGAYWDLVGQMSQESIMASGRIYGDSATDEAVMDYVATSTISVPLYFTFSYEVLA
jgi:hypothetical protein